MKYVKTIGMIVLMIMLVKTTAIGQSDYKITFYRAAPGQLLQLIEEVKKKSRAFQEVDYQPTVIRHSQGDHWDLLIVEFIGNRADYFAQGALDEVFSPQYGDDFYALTSYHESFIARGPEIATVHSVLSESDYFHFEIFVALAGKQRELLKQRQMENEYLKEIGRSPNLIFTINGTAKWDCFTIGGYRDIKHFAESADIPLEKEEEAAKKAGFKGVNDISPYLRSLIDTHQDTLGGKVKLEQ